MVRRSSKAEGASIVLVIVIGLPIYLASKLIETMGWILPVAALFACLLLAWGYKYSRKQKRLAYLRAKYADEDTVQKIYAGQFWEEQLRDALGQPDAV